MAEAGLDQPSVSTDDDLLRRWQDHGDLDALDDLLRSEVGALKALISARAANLVGGSASPSDIAQEAVLRLLRLDAVPHFTDSDKLRAYLWTTAWRLMLQRVRRPYSRKTSLDTAASSELPPAAVAKPGRAAEDAEAASALDLAMNLLPEDERDLLHRVYHDGRGIADLAREAGVSESAIKMRLMRTRKRLAARLAAWSDLIG
jgi:RNA polymerase sigma-70 factor, ECF subfamily